MTSKENLLSNLHARNGLGLSPDSLDYLSAGRNIAASGQLATFTGVPLTTLPAGFPATIAAVEWAGANALRIMIWVNVLCAGALVVLAYWTGTLLCRSRAWGLVAAALVAASMLLPTTFRALWSEPVFAVAVMVVVAVLVGALRRHAMRGRDAATLIVAANVAALYRYIGLALLPAIFLGVWWAGAGRSRRTRLRDAALITAGAAAGAAVNLLGNAAIGDEAMGPRYGSELGSDQSSECLRARSPARSSGTRRNSSLYSWWRSPLPLSSLVAWVPGAAGTRHSHTYS